ncbi:MAG TPA: amidohydrolase family protein [Nocardioidaceae bacterium]|nr:amidohydrolase family protein [Nocardioidaceae bacterium]
MSESLRVRGTVLPDGGRGELYVVDGRITHRPPGNATTVAEGWIVPGLVDAHCHVGLDEEGAVPEAVQEQQALDNRETGALLLRDCGVPSDTRWIDEREDLPRIVRAGRHIARPKRYIRNFAHEIEPHELPEYVAAEADRGDGWVKLVGDWIDRAVGDLAPLWPPDALAAAVSTAHEHGARVTAHVFGEQAMRDLVAAGVDCIEHGTGISPDLIDSMVANGVPLVPTAKQLENFPGYASAAAEKFPVFADHLTGLFERRRASIGAAYEAGVAIFAGTDAGGVLPHGMIAAEVAELVTYGLSTYDALGAASWRARAWLGVPATLEEGAPADLVVYPADPLADLSVLAYPSRVILRGHVVR